VLVRFESMGVSVKLTLGQVITVDLSMLGEKLGSRDDLFLEDTASSSRVGHVDIPIDGVLVSDRVPETCEFSYHPGFFCRNVLRGATTVTLRNTTTTNHEFMIQARDYECAGRSNGCSE
jgi:hypothetical protein